MRQVSGGQAIAPLQSLIGSRIVVLREQRVMLDSDLAELYGVETRILVQAVKRNLDRFPSDFMFQMSVQDITALRSQIVMSNPGRGGRRTAPYVFTEQGVAMLSSVLGSPRAIAEFGEFNSSTTPSIPNRLSSPYRLRRWTLPRQCGAGL